MTAEYLLVQPFSRTGMPSFDYTWATRARGDDGEISGQYAEVAGSPPIFKLPDLSSPFVFDIQVTPRSDRYWSVEATFVARGNGIIHMVGTRAPWRDNRSGVCEFGFPQSIDFALPTAERACYTILPVFLSRIRDVTDEIVALMNSVPDIHYRHDPTFGEWIDKIGPQNNWIEQWKPPPRHIHTLNLTPREGSLTPSVEVEESDVSLENRIDRVVVVKGTPAPRLIALSWPKSLDPSDRRNKPTPFFIMFRSYFLTNPGYYGGSPNRRWAFVFNSVWQWSNYQYDPVTGKLLTADEPMRIVDASLHRQGIPYQVEASGAEVVSLLPMGRMGNPPNEYGDFMKGDELRDILLEIQTHGWRSWGVPYDYPETVGRVAMGAFSMANDILGEFVRNPANNAFSFRELRELILIDPPTRTNVQQTALRHIAKWITAPGHPADDPPRVRLYTRSGEGADIVTRLGLPPEQVFVSVLSATAIAKIHSENGGKGPGGNDPTHAMYPGLFIKDALRRSGFTPPTPPLMPLDP
jgi:hypothetical protein